MAKINISQAAKIKGCTRNTIYKLIEKGKIKVDKEEGRKDVLIEDDKKFRALVIENRENTIERLEDLEKKVTGQEKEIARLSGIVARLELQQSKLPNKANSKALKTVVVGDKSKEKKKAKKGVEGEKKVSKKESTKKENKEIERPQAIKSSCGIEVRPRKNQGSFKWSCAAIGVDFGASTREKALERVRDLQPKKSWS